MITERLIADAAFWEGKCGELERELDQQRFNNKNNLSIDQKISDKINNLENQLADERIISSKRVIDLEDKLEEYLGALKLAYTDLSNVVLASATAANDLNRTIKKLEVSNEN